MTRHGSATPGPVWRSSGSASCSSACGDDDVTTRCRRSSTSPTRWRWVCCRSRSPTPPTLPPPPPPPTTAADLDHDVGAAASPRARSKRPIGEIVERRPDPARSAIRSWRRPRRATAASCATRSSCSDGRPRSTPLRSRTSISRPEVLDARLTPEDEDDDDWDVVALSFGSDVDGTDADAVDGVRHRARGAGRPRRATAGAAVHARRRGRRPSGDQRRDPRPTRIAPERARGRVRRRRRRRRGGASTTMDATLTDDGMKRFSIRTAAAIGEAPGDDDGACLPSRVSGLSPGSAAQEAETPAGCGRRRMRPPRRSPPRAAHVGTRPGSTRRAPTVRAYQSNHSSAISVSTNGSSALYRRAPTTSPWSR